MISEFQSRILEKIGAIVKRGGQSGNIYLKTRRPLDFKYIMSR